jgi:5-methyltetrahydrofolate--homocysteine methyltransferase
VFLIGETLNASAATVHQALAAGDRAWVEACARRQAVAGMDALDCCAAALGGGEASVLEWLAEIAEPAGDLPLCLDSPDPTILARVGRHRRHPPILNSLPVEGDWPEEALELVRRRGARVVLQLRRGRQVPTDLQERLRWAEMAVERAVRAGVEPERVLLDGVLLPWRKDLAAGRGLLDFVAEAGRRWPAIPTLVGLSNVSWGVRSREERRALHARWLGELEARGLGACLLDPFDAALVRWARERR